VGAVDPTGIVYKAIYLEKDKYYAVSVGGVGPGGLLSLYLVGDLEEKCTYL
jgi:hypothetical protein